MTLPKPPEPERCSLVILVEPDSFFVNQGTTDNVYQQRNSAKDDSILKLESSMAKKEHRAMCAELSAAGIISLSLAGPPGKPDAIFPNNSFSIHVRDGKPLAILYPMSPGRQNELTPEFIAVLQDYCGDQLHDLRFYETQERYLEGTGVLNFTRNEDAVLMCRSKRTDDLVLSHVCRILGIVEQNIFCFDSLDQQGRAIYHTNVMGWLGQSIAGICLQSIPDGPEKTRVIDYLRNCSDILLDLTYAEINAFAGNALEIMHRHGKRVLTLSKTAWQSLSPVHKDMLIVHYGADAILAFDVETIQNLGGGSVRCMQAACNLPALLAMDLCNRLSWLTEHGGSKILPAAS